METNSVTVNVERIVNLGNYENIKIQLGETKTINENQQASEVRQELTDQLLDELEKVTEEYK